MKRKASEGYPLIPAGEQVVLIKSVEDKDYEKFGKLTLVVEDAAGATANVNFNFINDDGTTNPAADGQFTRIGRAALNDQTLDEIDSDELSGKYIEVEIEHNEGKKGGTFANVRKILGHADGFPAGARSSTRSAGSKSAAGAASAHKKTAAEILAESRARRAAAQ